MKLERLQKRIVRIALALLIFAVLMQIQSSHLVFIPAAVVFLALAIVFMKSLRDQEVPLITRIARRARGVEQLDQELAGYTVKVTYFWILVFIGLTGLDVAFALFWPEHLPTWKASLITWTLLIGLGFGEYAFRKWHLRHFDHPPLPHLLSAIQEEIRISFGDRPFF
jgi:uncharacterized membrane protein